MTAQVLLASLFVEVPEQQSTITGDIVTRKSCLDLTAFAPGKARRPRVHPVTIKTLLTIRLMQVNPDKPYMDFALFVNEIFGLFRRITIWNQSGILMAFDR